MEALDRIDRQLQNGVFPHACLLSGFDAEKKEEAIKMIAEHFLGAGYGAHPDFFEIAERPIPIDAVAALKDRAARTPLIAPRAGHAGAKKIFLLRSLESLTRDAAPALLKTVEDPGEYGIFIATTEYAASIPPTVRSRFSEMRFPASADRTNADIERIKKMRYHDRFNEVPKLVAENTLRAFAQNALIDMRNTLRKHLEETSGTAKIRGSIADAERLTAILRMLADSSVNKRLIGEYIMMLL